MSQEFSSQPSTFSSSSSPSASKHNDTVVSLSLSRSNLQQRDKKEEEKLGSSSAATLFKFAISFPKLEKLTEYLSDKTEMQAVLAKIQKEMQQIERFFPIQDQNLYYPEIRARLEAIDRWLEQIPATAGFHYSIRTALQTAISPLQKNLHAFFLQEEGLSPAQLVARTQALYAQQAIIVRDKPLRKALSDTLDAIKRGLPEERSGQRCFISYAWPTAEHQPNEYWLQPFLRELHAHLTQAGIKPRLDIVDNQAGGNIVTFANHIKGDEFALLICTESLLDKHNHSEFKVIQTELSLLRDKYDADMRATGQVRVFPFLVSGSRAAATLPEHHLYRTVRDWRVQSYLKNLEQLIGWVYYPQGTPETYQKIWQTFYAQYPALASPMPDDHVKQELTLHWHQREMRNLQKERFYAGLLSQQHQPALPTLSGVEETKETKASARSHTHTTISYDMPRPVEGFIGRVELLKTLAVQFGAPDPSGERETKETKESKKGISSSTSNPRKLVLCTGLGGVGKTQLALRYADTATKRYQHKFWFAADNPDALNAGYRLFAKEKALMGEGFVPDKDVIKAVMQWLANQSNWLVIYDNVERYEDIVSYVPTQGAGDILLTSRLAPIRWPRSITAIAVDVLSMEEANQLIASLIDTPHDADIPKLATLLGFLPLALVQACAYIRNNTSSVANYLKLYEERSKYLLKQPDMPPGFPAHDPVFITWDMNLEAIASEEKAKGKQAQAKQLLQYCAFLGPQKIPSRVLETWHNQMYPATQEFMTEARSRLHAYSLIQLDTADQSIQVHRLVQQVMRERLSAQAQTAQLQQTLELLTDAYPQTEVGVGKAWDAIRFGFIPHLEMVIAYHAQYKLKEDTTQSLALFLLAAAYGELGQVGKKRKLLERALAIKEVHYGKDHYQVASTLMSLGNAYGQLGQAGKQRELLERALTIEEAHYGKDHYQVAITLNDLGTAYGLGQIGKARELFERALAIQEKHYGKDHYEVAMTLNNLGIAYGGLGQVGKQRELLERALAIKETRYGKDHYQVARTLANLGTAYGELGQAGKKRELLERALAIQELHYGQNHYQVARTLNNLGDAYGKLGDVGKQRELLERALPILEAHYGPMHAELAITLTDLAVAYQALKQPQAALQAAQRVYRNLMGHPDYGADHPTTKKYLQLLQSRCGFTLAMLQSDDAIPEEKQSTRSSLPATSPPPRESRVAYKTPATFPIDFNTNWFTETVEFRVAYDATVHHYFSDLAGKTGNGPQGKPLITLPDSISSASKTFTVSLSTVWLRQLQQNHPKGFHDLCCQLDVRENEMLAKIGSADVDNREPQERKTREIDRVPSHSCASSPLPSVGSLLSSIASASSSANTSMVPSSNFGSSLTSHSSASLFSSTTCQPITNRPSAKERSDDTRLALDEGWYDDVGSVEDWPCAIL